MPSIRAGYRKKMQQHSYISRKAIQQSEAVLGGKTSKKYTQIARTIPVESS